ncbi:hypothetical protein [Streptomyces sp. NPDC005799]|uniref:hypothetical protein n=1 Tax=Streptomyces sp. NPDC005799 TaxID=3154678 RepID=UPI0033E9AABC
MTDLKLFRLGEPLMNYDAPPTPTGPGWGQSLYSGAAGVALLHAVRAHTGEDDRDALRPWAAAMLKGPIQAAAEACGLYEEPRPSRTSSASRTRTPLRAPWRAWTHTSPTSHANDSSGHTPASITADCPPWASTTSSAD